MLWHEQSWLKLQKIDKNIPVVIPLGSCEQHGRHLPTLTDTLQVSAIADRVNERLANRVLFTPTLWLGSSDHHKDFPGTISVSPSLYSKVIKDVVSSILRSGFTRLVFLNGHGGNAVPASQALQEWVNDNDQADNVYLVHTTWWVLSESVIKGSKLGLLSESMFHACEYETSLILALRPELVDLSQIREGPRIIDNPWHCSESFFGNRVTVFSRHSRVSASGSTGKSSAASAEKGASILRAVVDETVAFIEDFATWPELPRIGPVAD